jgi:hypothetical protein
MMTKDEARRAVEAELRSRKLTTPMTLEQLNVFCEEMYKKLQFRSKTERLTDILKWADRLTSQKITPIETMALFVQSSAEQITQGPLARRHLPDDIRH